MPTYSYNCHFCGEFEVFQKITDEPLKICPHCKKENNTPKKLISLSNFVLVGSGWAKDNYK